MKTFNFKTKMFLALGATVVLGSAVVATAVTLSTTKKSDTKILLNNFSLNASDSAKNNLASSYATVNSTTNVQVSNNYWTDELIFKRLASDEELQTKDFILKDANGTFLNYFKDKYIIDFSSFANDLEGELYLKVSLREIASTSSLPKVVDHVFKVSGFKKVTFEDNKKYLFINSARLNMEGLIPFKNVEGLKQKYNSSSNEDKAQLINSFVEFDLSNSAIVNLELSSISFDQNKLKIAPALQLKVNAATQKNLYSTQIFTGEKEYISAKEFEVDLGKYFKIKNTWATQVTLSGATKDLSELTLDDIKNSFNKSTLTFSSLKLNHIPDGFKARISESIGETDNKYIFKYYVLNSNDLLEYVDEISIDKTALKQNS